MRPLDILTNKDFYVPYRNKNLELIDNRFFIDVKEKNYYFV